MFDFSKEPGRSIQNNYVSQNNKNEPLITVITPFYNAGDYIKQTYRCMINQTFPWFEWIIVDDGSTNKMHILILEELCNSDTRISLVRKKNGGIASARNVGIKKASTEIVVMLDADDLIVPTYLEVLYWMLYKNPEYDWAYTNVVGFQDKQYLWNKPFNAKKLKTYNFLTYSAAIRKNALQEVGMYDESEKDYYEDWHLWLRLLKKGKKPVKSGLYGFWYRRLETGILEKINKDKCLQYRAQNMIKKIADSIPVNIEAKEFPYNHKMNGFETISVHKKKYPLVDRKAKYQILMIIPWMRAGGSEVFVLNILKNINKEMFGVTIVTTVNAPLEWRQKFEEYTEDIFELPLFLELKDYPEFISYLISTRNIRLILVTNSYYGYCLMPWLRIQFPELAIIDYVHMEEWYWRRGGYARISSSMKELTEHTYVCNQHTRLVLMKEFGREEKKISTLYIGVDSEKYDETKIEKGWCYNTLGIPLNKKIVLFPCRMDAQKRPFLMLEIAKETKKRKLDLAFVVAGEGTLLEELKRVSKKSGLKDTVFFTGQLEDLRPCYKDAVVTLNCSIREGIALTTYESFAMGVPVISANVGGQKELVDDTTGKLVPLYQNEIEDFGKKIYSKEEIFQYVDALIDILSDERRYFSQCRECRKRVLKEFSMKKTIFELEKIFCFYIENSELLAVRKNKARYLSKFPSIVEELIVIYSEIEGRDSIYNSDYIEKYKNELTRIARSKWVRKLIKLFFQLRLNRIWK